MKASRCLARAHVKRGIAAALVAAVVGAAACRAGEGVTRGGVPMSGPRKTREELVREWDLNADGRIDPGEAEVAASKMRRERAELRLNSGIDPITGRPRSEEAAAASQAADPQNDPFEEDAAALAEEEPAADDARRGASEQPAKSGLRVPRPQLPTASQPTGKNVLNAGRKPVTGSTAAAAAERSRQAVTGGARAGGLPAQAGYGSGVPTLPLNAGKPVVPKVRVVGPSTPGSGQPSASRPPTTVTRPTAPPRPPATSREAYNPY